MNRNHVDEIALTPGAASIIDLSAKKILIGSAKNILSDYWQSGGQLFIVGAIGSAVRLVSPLLGNKETDPAVLVLDSNGLNIIPLIGGHIAGAEQIASDLAGDLGGRAIFTGDARNQGHILIDSFGEAWGWIREGSSLAWSKLMKDQAINKKIEFKQLSGSNLWQESRSSNNNLFRVDNDISLDLISFLIGSQVGCDCSWRPATLWIGIGCERNTSKNLIQRAIHESLLKLGLSKASIAGLATIDKKFDESALLELSNIELWPIRFFKAKELKAIDIPNPSKIVSISMHTPSVAEAASILAAGENAQLRLEKQIYRSQVNEFGAVTISIAESLEPYAPKRGELHVVGSGPGNLSLLTNDARYALSRSAVWIGYKRYLDLLEPLRRNDQIRVDGELTREKERCEKALSLARQGVRVALISSGDSGIYGMAGLALELAFKDSPIDRPPITVHPGISAFQIAAAKIGAPFMNDFCTISLSDLLTPWEMILERIEAAAKGDFVIAIYNPRSKDRFWQLKKSIEVLLGYRTASTPVAIGRQLSRENEKIELFTLSSIPYDVIDMLTFIVIGNSRSFIKEDRFVTPRGYLSF